MSLGSLFNVLLQKVLIEILFSIKDNILLDSKVLCLDHEAVAAFVRNIIMTVEN